MNPHKFSVFCIKKKTIAIHEKKIKDYLLKKIMTNFTAIFLHGTGWLNTLFHQSIEIPKLQKNCEYSLPYFYPFYVFKQICQPFRRKKITI